MSAINQAAMLAELEQVSDRYETALQANDLETLDALFWQDERVMRVAAKDELTGIEAIRRYRSARPLAELARERLDRHIASFGDHTAVVNVLFRRVADGRIGRQSQTWVRIEGLWRIVFAHISFREN